MIPSDIRVGDRVKVLLDSKNWTSQGWFVGTVVKIDAYSAHSNFHWVELDEEVQATPERTTRFISVLNPKNIAKINLSHEGGRHDTSID